MVRAVGANTSAGKPARRLLRVLFTGFFAFVLWTSVATAQQDARAVRSAYLYNITKYVSWPQPKGTLRIGVIGDAATAAAVKELLQGKLSDGRSIQVVLNPPDSRLSECDVIYIVSSHKTALTHILPIVSGLPILTVGDERRFQMNGGMVALVRSADRIEVEVNLRAVTGAGLKMSSRLLDLATVVSPKGESR